MNWLVGAQLRCDDPGDVAEVKVYVVRAQTKAGAVAVMAELHPKLMIRWMRPESGN